MTRWRMIVGLISASIGTLTSPPSAAMAAAENAHPDWPCVQRKVETLTSAQMWDGPDVDDLTGRPDDKTAKLVAVLASRRVPLDAAATAIAQFADAMPPAKRDEALKLLFAGVLAALNHDRTVVISGIERFQQRQRARAAEIERQVAALRLLRARTATDEQARAELAAAEEKYNWEVRIFTERQQSLPLACEVPVLIEQRLFELGRAIRSHMKD